ncbi:uncharacterized protein QC761_114180 [Podospora bellae-mahoneyi]|uniref:Uncharacterized protein n=1 Tax=Podospora bellae-mahoneyi TaxID=2093777 RepID=A0ABR0FZ65_9PEZI|nr:hypothetical protein QC761_114180 [Podospora bellae-mahoneyi]
MDRDKDKPDHRFAQTTRAIAPLTITSASKRRSLFSRPNLNDDGTRPASADAPAESRVGSPNNTRIPRLAQHRGKFTMEDAYRLATEEEEAAARGSPSPAPRTWRSRRESSEKNTSKLPGVGALGTQHRRTMTSKSTDAVGGDRVGLSMGLGGRSLRSNISDSSFDEKIRQHALAQGDPEAPISHSNSASSKAGLGTRILETGRGLVRRSSRGSPEGHASPRNPKTTTAGNRFSGLLSRKKRELSSSTQTPDLADWIRFSDGSAGDLARPASNPLLRPTSAPPDQESPERSFAWEAENDFTAGDLQVSESPAVSLGRSNTKIDEIRALEAEHSDKDPESNPNSWKNLRIDEIRNREVETASKPPELTAAPREVMEQTASQDRDLTTRSRSESNTSTKMDEIRSREIERVSRRAITTAQLGKIRERNAELTSRSPSPDMGRKPSAEPLRSFSPPDEQSWRRGSDVANSASQVREPSARQNSVSAALNSYDEDGPVIDDHDRQQRLSENAEIRRRGSRGRDESRDVLRRLSAAAITNQLTDLPASGISEGVSGRERPRQSSGSLRQRMFAGAKGDGKPTVGFVGLRRNDSMESNLTKRSSFILSESDPTERIEGEMNLFAPHENQSERGSLRALSPEPEEVTPDKTPKPSKPDPLMMPTPRVTGAFVETPATVKVEKREEDDIKPQPDKHDELPAERGRRGESVPTQPKQTQSSRGDRMSRRSSSISVRRRARSLSRGRPLINSGKPPTVRDDILEIQRANQIDDSTLDDIADLMLKQDAKGHDSEAIEIKTNDGGDDEKDTGDQDAQRLRRMSRSLQNGIMNIRTAKQGIQRLEDQVAHGNLKSAADDASETEHTHSKHDVDALCPICQGNEPTATTTLTYVHLPLPRLWHHQPRFKLTFLGLCVFLLSLWYIAESCMCHLYCKPPYCGPGEPCNWDIEYPSWGFTIPSKLDEWVTGGQGKHLVQEWTPEVTEWMIGLWDTAMSTDPESTVATRWSHSANRRRRRRVLRQGGLNH